MKAAFGAEAIGWGYDESAAALGQMARQFALAETAQLALPTAGGRAVDPLNRKPWLAEITGLHPRYRFERRFLPAKVDYARASSTGNRGVWFWWTLDGGRVYQVRYRTSWSGGYHTRLLTVDETTGDVVDIDEGEVIRWLSTFSASTS